MSRQDSFDGISEFLAVARRKSVRKAALDLEVSPGAISQALRKLELRLGAALFHRTTRSISLTEAGEILLANIAEPARAIEASLEATLQAAGEPSGTLKLLVERVALAHFIEPALPEMIERWPNLNLDITVSSKHDQFVSGGYDAGILLGSYIPSEMVAVRLTPAFQWAVFGTPEYFRKHGKPRSPADLVNHACIRYRRPSKGDVYRWEFVEDEQGLTIEPKGPITVTDGHLMQTLACRGVGLMYSSTFHASQRVADGQLEPVLLDYSPGSDGLFIYFTRAAQNAPKLRAFIDVCLQLRRQAPDREATI
jgi:DNA-binding transcriptional LysR family regulator